MFYSFHQEIASIIYIIFQCFHIRYIFQYSLTIYDSTPSTSSTWSLGMVYASSPLTSVPTRRSRKHQATAQVSQLRLVGSQISTEPNRMMIYTDIIHQSRKFYFTLNLECLSDPIISTIVSFRETTDGRPFMLEECSIRKVTMRVTREVVYDIIVLKAEKVFNPRV